MSEPQSNAARIREINDSLRYTMWSVFRLADVLGEDAFRGLEADEVKKLFAELGEGDVVVRGVYDVSGLRADADLMVDGPDGVIALLSTLAAAFAARHRHGGTGRGGTA